MGDSQVIKTTPYDNIDQKEELLKKLKKAQHDRDFLNEDLKRATSRILNARVIYNLLLADCCRWSLPIFQRE